MGTSAAEMTYSILISSKALQSVLELLAGLAVLLAFLVPRWGAAWSHSAVSGIGKFSKSRWRAVCLAAAFPMVVRVLLLPAYPIPRPYVHDEFSYLLMADTFAHGRLTNPSPPEWQHFETEYVLVKPFYVSQYQPAQGVFLAAAQRLTGNPWWGVCATVGLMCGALCWALSYVFSPQWALFGALAAALQIGIFGFWMNSYFGGAVAAAAGAIVVGALMRMRVHAFSSAIVCASGLAILFASRPMEAAIWTVVAAVWILTRHRPDLPRILIPATLILLSAAGALSYYDYRVTGSALEIPYDSGRRTYGTPQSFWWQPPVIVTSFNNVQIKDNYLNQLAYWQRRYSASALWDSTWRRLRDFWRFFLGPFLTPALLFAAWSLRDRRIRLFVYASIPFVLEHATYHAWYPQQSASETILIAIVLIQSWRHLHAWQRNRGWGVAISRNLFAGFAAAIFLIGAGGALQTKWPDKMTRFTRIAASLQPVPGMRDRVLARLQNLPGKHLVFVHYGPRHPYIDEWVFNKAEIPGAPVVFARLIDPDSDLKLIEKMPDYDVWLADPDAKTLRQAGVTEIAMLSRPVSEKRDR